MNTRLKILCLLLGIAYLYIIGESIIKTTIPMVTGSIQQKTADKNEEKKHRSAFSTYFFYVKPEKGHFTYPGSILNLKNGQWVKSEFPMLSVITDYSPKLPVWLYVSRIVMVFVSFGMLYLMIYIPVLVYKVIRSVIKNDIFDIMNIKRIRKIGYSILILFGFVIYFAFISTAEAKELFQFTDYNIVFSISDDYSLVLIGLMTLLFAEILKISHTMKEEQDLTI